jgi:translation initiation factor SUI1
MDLFFSEKELDVQKITIEVSNRTSKQYFTVISGWSPELDLKHICRHLKKKLSCGGNVSKHEQHGYIITLTGDQKKSVYDFLIAEKLYRPDEIIFKGL